MSDMSHTHSHATHVMRCSCSCTGRCRLPFTYVHGALPCRVRLRCGAISDLTRRRRAGDRGGAGGGDGGDHGGDHGCGGCGGCDGAGGCGRLAQWRAELIPNACPHPTQPLSCADIVPEPHMLSSLAIAFASVSASPPSEG